MREEGALCGSMLRLARLRGAGSFKPRNDGPLIEGAALLRGAAGWAGSFGWGRGAAAEVVETGVATR